MKYIQGGTQHSSSSIRDIIAFALSGLIILAGLVAFLTRGFNWASIFRAAP